MTSHSHHSSSLYFNILSIYCLLTILYDGIVFQLHLYLVLSSKVMTFGEADQITSRGQEISPDEAKMSLNFVLSDPKTISDKL